jgi:hypothetical protein
MAFLFLSFIHYVVWQILEGNLINKAKQIILYYSSELWILFGMRIFLSWRDEIHVI